jgi:hypothetical protein
MGENPGRFLFTPLSRPGHPPIFDEVQSKMGGAEGGQQGAIIWTSQLLYTLANLSA